MNETLTVRVVSMQGEAIDIRSIDLAALDGRLLPPAEAGAHIDVHVPGGPVRQYSLCNAPHDQGFYRVAVLKTPNSRGGSAGVHAMQVGQTLRIGHPRNHFPLVVDARQSLLFAGGIGITPILSMAQRLAAAGADFRLHYHTRSPDRTAFADLIRRSSFASRACFHHGGERASRLAQLREAIQAPAPGRHLYVCGPAGFMEAVLGTARELGWPADTLHSESFSPGPREAAGDAAFEVQIASSGALIRVAAGQTIVAALSAVGVNVPVSCEQGICGTCLTRVLEGKPDHRDLFMTDEEHARGDQITPCCSRSHSARLVLAL